MVLKDNCYLTIKSTESNKQSSSEISLTEINIILLNLKPAFRDDLV